MQSFRSIQVSNEHSINPMESMKLARTKYRKKPSSFIIAVQLNLDTEGFTYSKWGATQACKRGDWLVNNQGETYTVDAQTFAATYTEVSPGLYYKSTPVWAVIADKSGSIGTLEGETHYQAGDYLVYNDEAGTDGYAVSSDKFETMYEPAK